MSLIDKPWVKEPYDQITHEFDMSKLQNSLAVVGYMLSAAAVVVENQDTGEDKTADLVEGAASVSGNFVYITFKGGVTGTTYIARIRTTWTKPGSPNQLKENEFIIICQETGRST